MKQHRNNENEEYKIFFHMERMEIFQGLLLKGTNQKENIYRKSSF